MLKNHHLAKSISDVSWSQLTNFVSYKAEEAGKIIEFVNPKNTSQECSNCERKNSNHLSLAVRTFKCPYCGLVIDRDLNAAINILKKGLKKLNIDVGKVLTEFKPEDFNRRMIQEAPSFRTE
jgi:putative transposase